LFEEPSPSNQQITESFLNILRSAAEGPNSALPQLVSNPDYRGTFLRLTHNLAPTGQTFSELEIRAADETKPIALIEGSSRSINEAIHHQFPKPATAPRESTHNVNGNLKSP
jgi:hypothetical protein